MKSAIRYISAIFFCSIVLFAQGGFYAIHEHALEAEAHQCSHDGEHDSSYSEDCEVCEIHAKQHFISDYIPEFNIETIYNPFYFFPEESEFESERLVQYLRGPPLKA